MQTEMSSSPAGGLCLPAGKHTGILTYYQILSTKKWPKKNFFWSPALRSAATPKVVSTRHGGASSNSG